MFCKGLKKSSSMRATSTSDISTSPPSKFVKMNMAIACYNYTPVNIETDLALVRGEKYEILDSSGVWWIAKNGGGEIGLVPYNYVEPIVRRSTSLLARSANHSKPKTPEESNCCCPAAENCSANNPPLPIDLKQFAQLGFPWSSKFVSRTSSSSSGSANSSGSGHEPNTKAIELDELHDAWWHANIDRTKAESLLQATERDGAFLVRPSTSEAKCYTLSLLRKSDRVSEVKHYLIKRCATTGYYYFMKSGERFASLDELIKHYRGRRDHLATKLGRPPSPAPCRAIFHTNKAVDGLAYLPKDKSWEIKASELQLLEELGSGQFGVVRHGKWNGRVDVAVKLMKGGTMSEADFIAEASVMTRLQHDNLVKLYGLCIEHRPICIVAEFMKHGSLLSFLRKNEARLSESEHRVYILLNMCHQVASAMAYLETHNYIHRDLAARNCLVGQAGIVKVADFGLARYVIDDEYTCSGGTKFPIRWAPPEVLCYTRFSSKSDVWAYGILMWEVFTCGKLPYGKLSNAEVVERIRQGHRLEKPNTTPADVYALMRAIWHESPELRPSFAKIQTFLVALKARGNVNRHPM